MYKSKYTEMDVTIVKRKSYTSCSTLAMQSFAHKAPFQQATIAATMTYLAVAH